MIDWGVEGGRKRHIFTSIFLSHSTEKFQEGTLRAVVQKTSGFKKVLKEEGGRREYLDFASKFFCLTVAKSFKKESFCAVFQKISDSTKVYR